MLFAFFFHIFLSAHLWLFSESVVTTATAMRFHRYSNPAVLGQDEPVRIRYRLEEPKSQVPSWFRTEKKSPVVCIHGFGGNADQWRKNLPVISEAGHKAFAIDLLGYGYSDKPVPKQQEPNTIYNFENWADMTVDFIKKTVGEPCYLICNSVGGCVGLQAAVTNPELVKGVVLSNISLRMLHVKKQSPFIKPAVKLIQDTLRQTSAGEYFFKQVAEDEALRNVLKQAYAGDVDDETVELILRPGLEPGAAAVFLDFISYSGGPLPEELLAQCIRPVRMIWGERDPWEPISLGRELAKNAPNCVDEFVPLEGGGHCPMDQIPNAVNREILRFLREKK